ncbi:MAG TPA: glycosyltransferase, partial [Methylomirabilota bacterium]|nr:glycosyltransferase [Methylomirabilota bacterium]
MPASETPTISVLICTRSRRNDVARALASLRAAGVERDGVEIVVIEETAEPAPIPGVRYVTLSPEDRGFAHVRNLAVATAKGSVLVFVDDDCEVERGWFDALLAPLLADPGLGGVAGAVLVRGCNTIGYAESILGFPGGGLRYLDAAGGRVVPTTHLSTCNCAYRREAIEAAGGFSPLAALGGEDSLLVFVDDDCEVERGWFDALLAPLLADPGVGGVAGAVLVRDCNAIGYAESILGFPGGGLRYLDAAGGRVVPTAHLSTCNCAYRREAIEAAGGFSPLAALGGEDSLLAERVTARWPCRYVPAAVVYHKPRQRLPAVFRWFMRRGRAEMLILPAAAQPATVVRS